VTRSNPAQGLDNPRPNQPPDALPSHSYYSDSSSGTQENGGGASEENSLWANACVGGAGGPSTTQVLALGAQALASLRMTAVESAYLIRCDSVEERIVFLRLHHPGNYVRSACGGTQDVWCFGKVQSGDVIRRDLEDVGLSTRQQTRGNDQRRALSTQVGD
jgi:hypothetical protein